MIDEFWKHDNKKKELNRLGNHVLTPESIYIDITQETTKALVESLEYICRLYFWKLLQLIGWYYSNVLRQALTMLKAITNLCQIPVKPVVICETKHRKAEPAAPRLQGGEIVLAADAENSICRLDSDHLWMWCSAEETLWSVFQSSASSSLIAMYKDPFEAVT